MPININRPIVLRGKYPQNLVNNELFIAFEGDNDTNNIKFIFDKTFNGTDLSNFNIQLHLTGDILPEPKANIITESTGLTKNVINNKIEVTWLVANESTFANGTGTAQFKFFDINNKIWLSAVFDVTVSQSALAEQTIIDFSPNILEDLTNRVEVLENTTVNGILKSNNNYQVNSNNIPFNNSETNLESNDTENAIKEINSKVSRLVDYSDTIINDTNEFIVGQGTNIDVSDNVVNGNLRNVKLFGQSTDVISQVPAETIDINGNFETDSGWRGNGLTISISENVCVATLHSLSAFTGISTLNSVAEIIYGHKYFIKIDVFAENAGVVKLTIDEVVINATATIPNQWVSAYVVDAFISPGNHFFESFVDTTNNFSIGDTLRFRRAVLVDLTELGLEDLTADEAFARLDEDGLTFYQNEKQYTSQNITITNEATNLDIQIDATQLLRANNDNTVRDELDIDNSRLTQRIDSNGDVLMEPIIHDLPPFNRLRVDNGNIINVTIDDNTNLPIVNYETPIFSQIENANEIWYTLKQGSINIEDEGNYRVLINNEGRRVLERRIGGEWETVSQEGGSIETTDIYLATRGNGIFYRVNNNEVKTLIRGGFSRNTIGNSTDKLSIVTSETPQIALVNQNIEDTSFQNLTDQQVNGTPIQINYELNGQTVTETQYVTNFNVTITENMSLNNVKFRLQNITDTQYLRVCLHSQNQSQPYAENVSEADFIVNPERGALITNGENSISFVDAFGAELELFVGDVVTVTSYVKSASIEIVGTYTTPADPNTFVPFLTFGRKTIELSDIGATGLTAGQISTDSGQSIQEVINQLQADLVASERQTNIFSSSFTVNSSNYNTYMGKNNIYGASVNSVAQVRLPLEADTVYPALIEIQHFGGTSRGATVPGTGARTNLVVIDTQVTSEEIRLNSDTGTIVSSLTLDRGDTVVLSKSANGEPWIAVRNAQDPRSSILPNGLFTLNSRTITILQVVNTNTYNINGLLNYTPQQGDAFEVTASSMNDESEFTPIEVGDVIVAKVNNPNLVLSETNDDWLIIRDIRNYSLTFEEIRFLSQIEQETIINDSNYLQDNANVSDALVWLSPAVLTEAPFLIPSTDSNNPRSGQTITYIGGRDTANKNVNNQFISSVSRFSNYLYVGITSSYIIANGTSGISFIHRATNGDIINRYSLSDDFIIANASFPTSTVTVYAYTTDNTNPATINYSQGETLELWQTTTSTKQGFTNNVDVTRNVNNLQESQLSRTAQAKLNSISNLNEQRLQALEAKMDTMYQLAPDVHKLLQLSDIFEGAVTTNTVTITNGYDLIADYRGSSNKYESTGVTYDDTTSTGNVRYTGLTESFNRSFGFKVATPSDKVLMNLVQNNEVIPVIDMTASGTFRVNRYVPEIVSNVTVTNQPHLNTRTGGTDVVTTAQNSLATFTMTNFTSNTTPIARRLQIGVDILVNGNDTFAEQFRLVDVPLTNIAQSKQTVTAHVDLGPLHQNRQVTAVIGYTIRVSGSNIVADLTLESAPSDVTVRFKDIYTKLTFNTNQVTTARVDNWLPITSPATGNAFTFTGETELLVTVQPHTLEDFISIVPVALTGGVATELNDDIMPVPQHHFESVQVPNDIEFRTFRHNSYLRHSDLSTFITSNDVKWAYGLALNREVTGYKFSETVTFENGIIIPSPNETDYTIEMNDDGTLNINAK